MRHASPPLPQETRQQAERAEQRALSIGRAPEQALEGDRLLGTATLRLMTSDHLGSAIRRADYYPPGPGYGFGLGVAVRLVAGEAPFPGSVGDWFWSGVGGT